MRKAFHTLICLLAMMSAGAGLRAQEVTIVIEPGWNWISYPNAESMPLVEALSGFVPSQGDQVKSKYTTSTYTSGRWRGGVSYFEPGKGYHYYSTRTEDVEFVFAHASSNAVATAMPTDITAVSAVVGGMVMLPEGTHVFLRGVCWGTMPSPDIDGNHTNEDIGVGSFSSTLEGLNPNTVYYVRAYAVTDQGLAYGNEESFTTENEGGGDGHAYVDLGLPSGTLWATCNVGANAPEDYGDYFFWNGPLAENYSDDWGSEWRIPIEEDWGELCNHTTVTWTTQNGVNGGLFTASNGNSLFLPAAGRIFVGDGIYLDLEGSNCIYWSSADYYFLFNSGYCGMYDGYSFYGEDYYSYRDYKQSVRAVRWGQNSPSYSISVSASPSEGGSVSGNGTYKQGQCCTLTATANEGYSFVCWTKNGSQVYFNSNYSFTVTENANYVGEFSLNSYAISASVNSSVGGAVSGGGTYSHGSTCTLTATANEGYSFTNWTENDSVVSTDAVYSFMVNGNRTLVANFAPTGAIDGKFSINGNGEEVYFSQGNLQYIGSAATPYWKFADNQWDVLGATTGQDGSSQNIDRDLFGWGASGYNHGAVCYQPWSISLTNSDYYAYGQDTYNLYDQTGQADWGHNAILNGGNTENSGWRTLTKAEWVYLFNTRTTPSGVRYAKASVNNVNGVILLPDDWSTSYYTLNNTNSTSASFSSNTITVEQWNALEQYGAVFLPAAGGRKGTSVYYVGSRGYYWSSSYNDSDYTYDVYFLDSNMYPQCRDYRYYGRSVRLVHSTYTISVSASPSEGGNVSGGDGTYVFGQSCTLTATANPGYAFINWTENGEVVSTDAVYSFTVNGNRTLTANYDHAYVDLGLPSGTLWATCNIGANAPEDYGDYFAWRGDPATANWGGAWCMPTKEEFEDLYNNTTVTWTTQNGVNGRLFTASNGNSIFLPAAGYYDIVWFDWDDTVYEGFYDAGSGGRYWSNTYTGGDPVHAWYFYFSSDYYYMASEPMDCDNCETRQPVRPVRSGQHTNYTISVSANPSDGGSVSGDGVYEWGQQCTLTATANDGYTFTYWTDNGVVVSTDAVYSFMVNGNHTMTANFAVQDNNLVGIIKGKFSINGNGDEVYFSQGNLQYIGSTATPFWKFADHQWDCLGEITGQNSGDENVDRDLFGWGASGYNHGAICYQPWSTSLTNSDYYAYGQDTYNLYDQTGQADWGHHAILNGGNTENNGWRTLTKAEWVYLLNTRATSSGIRYAKASVNDVGGVILLPDDWSASYYPLNNTNSVSADFSSNTITAEQWNALEQHGAVFLPAAGGRKGTSVYYVGSRGYYWSSSYNSGDYAYDVYFLDSNMYPQCRDSRYYGRSVRLVRSTQDFTVSVSASPSEGGSASGDGNYIEGADCTLTVTATPGYTFINWTENGEVVSTDAIYTFTVDGNRNLVANFEILTIGGHGYVDLGLPSGTLWATCNIGANTPEEYGHYIGWSGMSLPENYNDDWDSEWHIPTKEDYEELYNNTITTWTTLNGVNGRLFIASNGNSLFLPAAGSRLGNGNLDYVGSRGYYWSSTLHTGYPNNAWGFGFYSGGYYMSYGYCGYRQSVRAVRSSVQN